MSKKNSKEHPENIPNDKKEKIFSLNKNGYDSVTISFIMNIPESTVRHILEDK